MKFVADLHLHSPYARACSKDLTFENLARWAQLKGIHLLASADFTHPAWFAETKAKLRQADGELFQFGGVKFVLGTEVSCIFSQGGRGRRIHLLLFAPNLETVEKINAVLGRRAHLASDGRPTLGLSARNLTSLVLSIEPRCLVVPAHVWTPWFSVYGSKSGFDSLEECFGDLADQIFAVETGLSSDPGMNWRIPELDNRSIVSFSDAHSLSKMGRELTVFDAELSYEGLRRALQQQQIAGTVEFFPEEGKYHYTGHRECGVRHSPEDTAHLGTRCPKCGRPLTVGVMHRVEELARRPAVAHKGEDGFIYSPSGRPPYKTLVPLQEILAEAFEQGVATARVQTEYLRLVNHFGNELALLLEVPIDEVHQVASSRVADGIDRVRRGDIAVEPGYDGLYGEVRIWPETPSDEPGLQMSFFREHEPPKTQLPLFDLREPALTESE